MAQEIAAPGQVVISDQTAELIPGVTLLRAGPGFHLLTDLSHVDLPPSPPDLVPRSGPDDLATLFRWGQRFTPS